MNKFEGGCFGWEWFVVERTADRSGANEGEARRSSVIKTYE
jgi:hypothetical protein